MAIPGPIASRLLPVLVRTAWGAGWLLALQAASARVVIEPTDEAIQAISSTAPYGYVGAGIMLAAALTRFAYRGWLSAAWFSLLPLVTLLLLLERVRGATLAWHLLTLLAAAGLGSWSVIRARQDAAA